MKKMSSLTKNKTMGEESPSSRYQQLKQKKEALEKKLNEKYEQLHQICQNEAHLIANNLDLMSPNSGATSSQSTIRKKIGSSFKLPEHLNDDEINKLLLQRQMQQQILKVSFRIANDPLQSKSIRRTHRQTYETSQQKIVQINESINIIQRQRQNNGRPLSQDDIDLHRSDNRYVKNTLAMVDVKNLHILNVNNLMSERRNSMKSTTSSLGSSNTFIVQASPSSASSLTSLKTLPNNGNNGSPRVWYDNGNNSSNRFDYEFHQKLESPTPSSASLQSPQNMNQHHIPLCSQSLKNIKINTDNHPTSSQDYYNNFTNQHSQFMNNQHFVQQTHHSPQSRSIHPSENKFIHRLHSFHQQFQHDMQQKQMMVAKEALQDDRMRQLQKAQSMNNQSGLNHYTPAHSAGLGGFWRINETNQRVWVSDVKYPLSPPATNMSKKSNSLGNFEFMHKNDIEQHDSLSISSGNSNEHKKKEKVWCETSLDVPVNEPKQYRPRVESPTSSDYINNNHQGYEITPPLKTIQQQILGQHYHQSNSGQYANKMPSENIYLNPLANTNSNPPNIPPKNTKLRYSESIRSTISSRDIENNIVSHANHTPPIQLESPKNVTIIQEGSWKPYKEEIKSYEISDFYKYSQKYRLQQQQKQNADC